MEQGMVYQLVCRRFERFMFANSVFVLTIATLVSNAASITAVGQTNEAEVTLKLTSGEILSAVVESIDDERIEIRDANGTGKIAFENIALVQLVGALEAAPARFNIRLCDESSLRAAALLISDNTIHVKLAGGAELKFRDRLVRWIKLDEFEANAGLNRQWVELLADDSRTSDAVVVNRDGELGAIEGVIGDLRDQKVAFSIGDRSANIELEKIKAMIFYQASGQEFPLPVCRANLIDGSMLMVQRITLTDNTISGATIAGADFQLSRADVASLDFAMGRDQYLDELTPTTNDWKPQLASKPTIVALRSLNKARPKLSFSGKPLSILVPTDETNSINQTRQFEHGFAIRAGGKLAFSLDEQYSMLTGLIGFDPDANVNGNVLLIIQIDGKIAIEAPLVKQSMKRPLEINLDVTGIRRVVIQVDYHDGRSIGDQIHAVDLKVSK